MADIRYHEKLKKLKAGQACSDCGIYYFFDEDPEIEHTGACKQCTANYEKSDMDDVGGVGNFREEISKDIEKYQKLKRR